MDRRFSTIPAPKVVYEDGRCMVWDMHCVRDYNEDVER